MGGQLSQALRASWLPKITNGWFFRAESFFSVARYLDEMARQPLSGEYWPNRHCQAKRSNPELSGTSSRDCFVAFAPSNDKH
jgi:predicted ATPase